MKKVVSFIIISFFSFLAIGNEHYTELLNQANTQYAANNYEEAITLYEKIVASEYESATLYYNLGNSYFKLKEYPKAILYYEKANKLAPSNADIKFNLVLINKSITDKISPIPDFFIIQWWKSFIYLFSIDTWAWITIVFFFIFSISLMKFLLDKNEIDKRFFFYNSLFFIGLTFFTFFVASIAKNSLSNANEAIVFAPTVNVKSSPSISSTDLFIVHAGTKIKLLEKVNDWQKIALSDGNIGWISVNEYVEI